jgi:hypothetical protein
VLVVLLLVRCHSVTYVTGTVTVIIKELVFFLWLHIMSVIIVLCLLVFIVSGYGLELVILLFVYRILSVMLCLYLNLVGYRCVSVCVFVVLSVLCHFIRSLVTVFL